MAISKFSIIREEFNVYNGSEGRWLAEGHRRLAIVLADYAVVVSRRGCHDDAVQILREALNLRLWPGEVGTRPIFLDALEQVRHNEIVSTLREQGNR